MLHELIINHTWFIYLVIALFSLAIGSLLNVIIYRIPLILEKEWQEQYKDLMSINEENQQSINLFFPRSFCPACKATITAWQNVPILSYLFLRGRCYQCKKPISIRYLLVELSTMLLSLYASWHFGFTPQLFFALIAIWILISLFCIDLNHQILPDNLTLTFLWIGLIANTQNLFTTLPQAVLSTVCAYMGLWLFIKIFYLITGKVGMGNGDFKLFAAFGAWFGWVSLPLILFLSSISGTIIGLIYVRLQGKSKNTTIPFGPFLCISGIVFLFWRHNIVHFWM